MYLAYFAFALILVASVIAGQYIHAYHFKYATEGSMALLLGSTITGLISLGYYAVTKQYLPPTSLTLPDTVFFHILLPPIIFYAGFSIKKRMFFQNVTTIFTFGFFATLTSAAAISAAAASVLHTLGMTPQMVLQTSLALGAVCACSDTVAILQIIDKRAYPVLYSIVFGEGIVNDAVAVVLLGAVDNLASHHTHLDVAVLLELLLSFLGLFVSSLLLGASMGLLSALMVRHIFKPSHDCDREVLLLGLLGYISYLLADAWNLSAIMTVFFCGVTMSHYTWHSLCPTSQALTVHTFRVAAVLMEMILYAYSGVNVWTTTLWQQPAADIRKHLRHALALASVMLVAAVVARVAFTYPVSALLSRLQSCAPESQRHISMLDGTTIMCGGLTRGAITLALAYHHFSPGREGMPTSDHQVIVLSVVIVVLISTVVLGTITGPLMEYIMQHHKQHQHKRHIEQQLMVMPWPWLTAVGAAAPATTHHAGRSQAAAHHLSEPLLQQHDHLQQRQQHVHWQEDQSASWGGEDDITGTVQAALPRLATGSIHSSSQPMETDAEPDAASTDPGLTHADAVHASGHTAIDLPLAQEGRMLASDAEEAEVVERAAASGPAATAASGRPTVSAKQLRAAAINPPGRVRFADEVYAHLASTDHLAAALVAPAADRKRPCTAPVTSATALEAAPAGSAWLATPVQRLPSMDEFSGCVCQLGDSALQHGNCQVTAPAVAALCQPELVQVLDVEAGQQSQRTMQHSRRSSVTTVFPELPHVVSPSDADGSDLGSYLPLSMPATSAQMPAAYSPAQQQHGSANGLGANVVFEEQPPNDASPAEQHNWFVHQQQRLMQHMHKLHQQYRQHQQQQGAAARLAVGSWSLQQAWRSLDRKFLQPVFGGRHAASTTPIPLEFEHYGVHV